MKKFFQRTSLLLAAAFIGAATLQAQKSPQDMDRFIDALIKRMTVEEKIGQLNLPVTGEITTGQAKSSDVAKKIEQGLVGGLFNLKGVAKIRDVQKLAVENSRLGIPLLFGMDVIHGYETIFPIPLGLSCTWDMAAIQESARIAPGTTEVEQYGHNGYAVQTYRSVYAGDGTLLRSTKEAYSDNDRADKIILVAPGELPQ